MSDAPRSPVNHGATLTGQQRGAALLTAMVIVTLVATLAAAMVWQQWRAVQVEAAERARSQAHWILGGAVDWARLILREDAVTGGADHLGEPWAVPLAEAKLSTFLATDRDNTDDGPQAFLSGAIIDAQSRYNLRNLAGSGPPAKAEERILLRLLELTGAPAGTGTALAQALREASPQGPPAAGSAPAGSGNPGSGSPGNIAAEPATPPPGGSGEASADPPTARSADPPLPPERVAQLAWLGVDRPTLERLAPYVTLLPVRTPVNLNTAPKEVLAAVLGVDLASAERLVQTRQRTPFKAIDEARALLPQEAALDERHVSVTSSFFEVQGRLRLEDRVIEERALVERRGRNVITLRRERVAPQVDNR